MHQQLYKGVLLDRQLLSQRQAEQEASVPIGMDMCVLFGQGAANCISVLSQTAVMCRLPRLFVSLELSLSRYRMLLGLEGSRTGHRLVCAANQLVRVFGGQGMHHAWRKLGIHKLYWSENRSKIILKTCVFGWI